MHKILIIALLLLAFGGESYAHKTNDTSVHYIQNRHPLRPNPYLYLPYGAIKPKGWVLQQLITMKNGMAGPLDNLYPAVLGPRNGWLGGDGDVWERGPYWL